MDIIKKTKDGKININPIGLGMAAGLAWVGFKAVQKIAQATYELVDSLLSASRRSIVVKVKYKEDEEKEEKGN